MMEAAGICAATVAAGFRVFVVVAGFVAGAAVLLCGLRRWAVADQSHPALQLRARVHGLHDDGRWDDLRVFADRQQRQREQTRKEDQARQDGGEDRPIDEEL